MLNECMEIDIVIGKEGVWENWENWERKFRVLSWSRSADIGELELHLIFPLYASRLAAVGSGGRCVR